MVIRHVRRRDQDSGFAHIGQFCQCRGTCPAQDQIGRGHHTRHIINVFAHLDAAVLGTDSLGLNCRACLLPVAAADRVNHAKILLIAHQRQQFDKLFIHVPRAQRAPYRHDQLVVDIHSQLSLGRFLRVRGKRAAHRRSGNSDTFGIRVGRTAFLKADHNAIDMPGQQLCCQPGDSVRFMHERRNMHARGLHQHRIADIAAGTDHRVGLKLLNDATRALHRREHVFHGRDILRHGRQIPATADIGNMEPPHFIALARQQLHFHLSLGTKKQDAAVRIYLPQPTGHGDGRIDMPCGPPTGKEEIHSSLPFICFPGTLNCRRECPLSTHSGQSPSRTAGSTAPCRRS